MPKKKNTDFSLPTIDQLLAEQKRLRRKNQYRKVLRSTVGALVVVAATAVLVATLMLPVLRIYGASMSPTLTEGNIVVSLKHADFECGDVIAFYYENKVLVKRVIAHAGEWVNIDDNGNVYVNGNMLDEPYITDKALGECNIDLPYQVPEGKIFVMGDHRSVSVDSRSTTIGCISEEQIVGKLVFCIWPIENFKRID